MTVFVANRFHDAATTAFMNKISLKFSVGGGWEDEVSPFDFFRGFTIVKQEIHRSSKWDREVTGWLRIFSMWEWI